MRKENMMGEPRIEMLVEKKLVGKRMRMRLAENKTYELWHSFMTRRKEILNTVNADLISMQVYDESLDMKDFSLEVEFEKWAAVEVSDHDRIPEYMEAFILEGGLYAVFQYKGTANEFADMFRYIFSIWLPGSGYIMDSRPHFEILGAKYKRNDPDSEEEIWVPVVKTKNI